MILSPRGSARIALSRSLRRISLPKATTRSAAAAQSVALTAAVKPVAKSPASRRPADRMPAALARAGGARDARLFDYARADFDELVDSVLATVMRGPRSYTGEDVLEIHGHGGPAALPR